ncbi:MAG: hypothetical protein ABW042_10580 [Phenylobacterium sp.]
MRAALSLLAIAVILASPSAAQEKRRFSVPQPQAPAAPPRGVAPPAEPVAPLVPTLPATTGLTLAPVGGMAGQCRARCDRTYYACLSAEDDATSCSSTWGQCRSRCVGN